MDLSDKKVLVTGGRGFLGTYVVEELKRRGVPEQNILVPDAEEYDLTKLENCRAVVSGQNVVIHLAAKVGGIGFNKKFPGEIFYDNIMMGVQLMEAARQAGIEKFVSIGTVCAYPKDPAVPFKEDDLWNGYPEEINAYYGLAKKMLLVQGQAYRKQYGFNAIYLLPTNLYGPRDHFDSEDSHVIPALLQRIWEAKRTGQAFIENWGTGKATREFLFARDAAEGIVSATEVYDSPEPVNLGSSREISIKDATEIICKLLDYQGEVRWDASKPDGQLRRSLDTSRAKEHFGFEAKTGFEEGMRETIDWFLANSGGQR